ncbi:hypothetical protein PR048_006528 [Dryococelus australis]|uniref:Peptidase S1 domain-containing protein n=1 Tax=Dryococelus australis TaxID=614101 RepID=A0ABQ9IB84_9NEOP|nr:hypothetical protein PR048_006528 [Dryococelus australis]
MRGKWSPCASDTFTGLDDGVYGQTSGEQHYPVEKQRSYPQQSLSNGRSAISSRIAGGSGTTIEKFPYVVSVREDLQGGYDVHICGGSIISNYWVLTSGQCVIGDIPDMYVIRAGNDHVDKGTRYKLSQIVLYKEFQSGDIAVNDISLLKVRKTVVPPACIVLDKLSGLRLQYSLGKFGAALAERLARLPLTKANRAPFLTGSQDFRKWESYRTMSLVAKEFVYSNSIKAVKLVEAGKSWGAGTTATVAGWGPTLPEGNTVDVLRVATVSVVSNSECTTAYKTQFHAQYMMCVNHKNVRQGACVCGGTMQLGCGDYLQLVVTQVVVRGFQGSGVPGNNQTPVREPTGQCESTVIVDIGNLGSSNDEGSALVHEGVQIGVVSLTTACFNGTTNAGPGIYTSVSYFRNWIKSETGV